MNYKFTFEDEKFREQDIVLYSGNVNSYTFEFEFGDEWTGLTVVAAFTKEQKTYTVYVEGNMVTVPYEVLGKPGLCVFGVYGTDVDGMRRISGNEIILKVKEGSYKEGTAPIPPQPDVWETLFKNSTPKRGEDYWTEEDIAEIKSYVDAAILGGEW